MQVEGIYGSLVRSNFHHLKLIQANRQPKNKYCKQTLRDTKFL